MRRTKGISLRAAEQQSLNCEEDFKRKQRGRSQEAPDFSDCSSYERLQKKKKRTGIAFTHGSAVTKIRTTEKTISSNNELEKKKIKTEGKRKKNPVAGSTEKPRRLAARATTKEAATCHSMNVLEPYPGGGIVDNWE